MGRHQELVDGYGWHVRRRVRAMALLVAHSITASIMVAQAASRSTRHAPHRISSIPCGAFAHTTDTPTLIWRGRDVRWAEWRVALGARAVSSRIIVVRFDPRMVRLSLDLVNTGDAIGSWSLDRAPIDALLALNAGQFTDDGPWGWVVHRGREWQAPGAGTLAGALVIDSTGAVSIVDAGAVGSVRASGRVREAVQAYPTLLATGDTAPTLVCNAVTANATPETILDRTHRDTRLAIGTTRDGFVVIAMSRFAGLGVAAERLPIGPTTPEMAEIMRRLGATRALMLDGGLSAQLLVRATSGGTTTRWPGLRSVPLALVGKR